jgi:exodeoxyribonuclease VII large subunit
VEGRIAAARAKVTQGARLPIPQHERRVRQQGVDPPQNVLHRRVGRGLQRVDELEYRLRDLVRTVLDARERGRRAMDVRLRRFDIRPRLAGDRRRMDASRAAATQAVRLHLVRRRARLEQVAARLSQLSPLRILERGYAIVSNEAGILKDAVAAAVGSRIHVRLAKGELDATIEGRETRH